MRPPAAANGSQLRKESFLLGLLAAAFFLLLCGFTYRHVVFACRGHFLYALDDPFIHLALSEQIAQGHYGINAHEAASPSSSALWPLLLAPFARLRWALYAPLLLNLLAGVGAAILAGAAVARWPSPPEYQGGRATERVRRALTACLLVFVGNLVGLTFIGMEHTLQVLLAGAGAWAVIACLRGRPIPWWCLVAVAIGPSVRYESLGITLAVAIALLGQRKPGRAAGLLAASLLPLLVFSAFLRHLGLPWLPTSVLVKGQVAAAGTGMLHQLLTTVQTAVLASFTERHRMLVLILFLSLVGVAWDERTRERRFALWGAAAALGLHLLIGRFHWFHRYEVYTVFFSVLILLHLVHERPRTVLGWHVLALLGCSYLYLQAFHDVPISASQVYRQQYQMHRFTTEFYTGNVAVNDLGLVSFQRPSGTYVLDLWGLGSVDAARQKNKSTAWLQSTVEAHHVGLVMDYTSWFAPPPPEWTRLGALCLDDSPIALGGSCVDFYATKEGDVPALKAAFARFAATVPPGDIVHLPSGPLPPR